MVHAPDTPRHLVPRVSLRGASLAAAWALASLGFLGVPAPGLACDRLVGSAEVAALSGELTEGGDSEESGVVAARRLRLSAAVACLDEPLSRPQVAEVHLAEAVAAQAEGNQARRDAALDAWLAVTATAELPASIGSRSPLHAALADARLRAPGPSSSLNARRGGWVEVDGRYAISHPDDRPYFVQEFDGAGVVRSTRYLWPAGLAPVAVAGSEGQGAEAARPSTYAAPDADLDRQEDSDRIGGWNSTAGSGVTSGDWNSWLRVDVGGVAGVHTTEQVPDEKASSMFPETIDATSSVFGVRVRALAWVPSARQLGLEASLARLAYSLDGRALCDAVDMGCPGVGVVEDSVVEARAVLRARYLAPLGASRVWIGGRVGYAVGDVQVVETGEDRILLRQYNIHSLAGGLEAGADIGDRVGVTLDATGTLAGASAPFEARVGAEVSYSLFRHLYLTLGGEGSLRSLALLTSAGEYAGRVDEACANVLLSTGMQF